MAITPGGRPADDSPFSTSTTDNWVARAGGLPKYVREIAHALVRNGHTESDAIATAVATVKRWAVGRQHVRPQVRAAAAKTVAEWEAKRGAAHVNLTSPQEHAMSTVDLSHVGFKALEAKLAARGDVTDPAAVAAAIGRRKYGAKKMEALSRKGIAKETHKAKVGVASAGHDVKLANIATRSAVVDLAAKTRKSTRTAARVRGIAAAHRTRGHKLMAAGKHVEAMKAYAQADQLERIVKGGA